MDNSAKKIISAGHICIDITPVFLTKKSFSNIGSLLEPGKLIHMKEADVHTGGSVANTGLALKILGANVKLMGKIGEDSFGTMVKGILDKYDAGEHLLVDRESSTSYSVVIAVPGVDRIFLHNPGANDTFTNSDIPEEELEDAVFFHFGYPPLMKKMFEEDGKELITIFKRMKKRGIATSLDFAAIDPDSQGGAVDWRKLLDGVLPYTDFFVPSFEELLFMLNRERYMELVLEGGDITGNLDVERDVKPLAVQLMQMGCKVVLIKCGTAGMYFQTGSNQVLHQVGERLELNTDEWAEQAGFQACFKADCVLSGTGAGDTSIAAFLAAVLKGKSPQLCTALAAAEGACSVTAYDALSGLKSLEELEARIALGWKTMN